MKLTRYGHEVLLRKTSDPHCTVCPQLRMDFGEDLGWREYRCKVDNKVLDCFDEPLRSERCYQESDLDKE